MLNLKRPHDLFRFIGAVVVVMLALVPVVPAQAQRSPFAGSRFSLSVDGVTIGVFAQLTSEGDLGAGTGGKVMTLSNGQTRGGEMAAWHELVILGDVAAARKDASIIIYDYQGAPVKRYHIRNAWPAKISIDSSGRLGSASVMLVYETLRVSND